MENLEKILKKGVDNGGRIWYIKRAVAERAVGLESQKKFSKKIEKRA